MARIRTVKPEFWGHPKVVSVSRDARLLFLGLLNEVDDFGRMRYSAKKVAGVVFPEDNDVTAKKVAQWVAELEEAFAGDVEGLVLRYEVAGAPLLAVLGFTEHQKVSHPTPSKLPEPPEVNARNSGAAPESFCPDLGTGNREQGTGNMSPPRATRAERDALFDAVKLEYGGPESRGGLIALCVSEILEQGGRPEEVPFRAAECRRRFPIGGPRALSQHWGECGETIVPGSLAGILNAQAPGEIVSGTVGDLDAWARVESGRALEVGG
jgi:hypothetical protein